MSDLYDPGLQPERTELAWRRTCLSLFGSSLIAIRLLPAAFGDARWALPGVAGLIATVWFWRAARGRYRGTVDMLALVGDRAALPGGVLVLALTLLTTVIGALSAALVIALAIEPSGQPTAW